MCGIAGCVSLDDRPVQERDLRLVADALSHRGPDGSGIRIGRHAGLAHRRLAIIDLKTGAQPLSNEDGSVWVTFNGEIYNYVTLRAELRSKGHTFRTDSDTEVLVHGWEEWHEGLPGRLRGMFAFAVWDEGSRRLFLARDRLGIKPLVYGVGDGVLTFSSELQALRREPGLDQAIDVGALDLYLHFQYIPAPFTIYRGIRKLEPAHYLVVDDKGVGRPTRYWSVEFRPERDDKGDRWLAELEGALDESVAAHLVSDVPFGAFLSGGVDSSAVVGLMSRHLEHPVRSFSIGFDEESFDETSWARRAAGAFGTQHEERKFRRDGLALLPTLVRHFGEPFADSSALPTWELSGLAASRLKMVLSGDGGDELFAGYTSYAGLLGQHRQPKGALARTRFLVGGWARGLGLRPPLPAPERTWFESVAYFGGEARRKLWRPDLRGTAMASWEWFEGVAARHKERDLCSRFQSIDLETYLPNDILTKVDIASMAHGLEVRVPLLDHKVVELAARIPLAMKIRQAPSAGAGRETWDGKLILKRLVARMLGEDFVARKKQGFAVPLAVSFRQGTAEEMKERLTGRGAALTEYLQPDRVNEYVAEHMRGSDHSGRLWSLFFLEEWLEQERARPAVTAGPIGWVPVGSAANV